MKKGFVLFLSVVLVMLAGANRETAASMLATITDDVHTEFGVYHPYPVTITPITPRKVLVGEPVLIRVTLGIVPSDMSKPVVTIRQTGGEPMVVPVGPASEVGHSYAERKMLLIR